MCRWHKKSIIKFSIEQPWPSNNTLNNIIIVHISNKILDIFLRRAEDPFLAKPRNGASFLLEYWIFRVGYWIFNFLYLIFTHRLFSYHIVYGNNLCVRTHFAYLDIGYSISFYFIITHRLFSYHIVVDISSSTMYPVGIPQYYPAHKLWFAYSKQNNYAYDATMVWWSKMGLSWGVKN